jgi:hypothetical protein
MGGNSVPMTRGDARRKVKTRRFWHFGNQLLLRRRLDAWRHS